MTSSQFIKRVDCSLLRHQRSPGPLSLHSSSKSLARANNRSCHASVCFIEHKSFVSFSSRGSYGCAADNAGRVAVEEEESQKPEFMKTILRLARVFAVVKRKRRRGRGDSRSRPTTTSATAQSDGLRSSESRTKDSIKILIRWLASLSRLDIIRCLTHATPRTSSSKSVSAISRSDAYQRG